jgi:hypothetical protein
MRLSETDKRFREPHEIGDDLSGDQGGERQYIAQLEACVAQRKVAITKLVTALRAISNLTGRHDLPDAWNIANQALRDHEQSPQTEA